MSDMRGLKRWIARFRKPRRNQPKTSVSDSPNPCSESQENELDLSHSGLLNVPQDVFCYEYLNALILSDNRLRQLSPSVAVLLWLERLHLDRNDLTDIPDSLKYCKRLRLLDLSLNPLSSSLTDAISQLHNLTELSLNSCSLTSLPPGVGVLVHLRSLEARHNQLRALPQALGCLHKLNILDLEQNVIRRLPDALANLAALHFLNLAWNELTDLPESLGNLSSLQVLHLQGNYLRTLPDDVEFLDQLVEIDLSHNQLSALPDAFCNLAMLEVLRLDNNRLQTLPEHLGRLYNLRELTARANDLSWLPGSMGAMDSLCCLFVDDNCLSALPYQIGLCHALVVLSISHNRLQSLPDAIGLLHSLRVLDLRANHIQFLPNALAKLNLPALWLAYNQTSPRVPLVPCEYSGLNVLSCVLLPQEAELYKDGLDIVHWGISPSHLDQSDREHRLGTFARLAANGENASAQPKVHILPSAAKKPSTTQPIRPYAMVHLSALQAQIHKEYNCYNQESCYNDEKYETPAYEAIFDNQQKDSDNAHYESIL